MYVKTLRMSLKHKVTSFPRRYLSPAS